MGRFISKADANKLMKKLQMKYGAELEKIQHKIEDEIKLYGFVTMETEIERDELIDKIKQEEKHYQ